MPSVSQEKLDYETRMNKMLDSYSRVLFVTLDNVSSQQVNCIRRDLRPKAELLVGKKTHQCKILSNRASRSTADATMKKAFVDDKMLKLNRGLIFTNSDPAEISIILQRYRKQAPARVGAIAPVDVIVPAGNTGMEPTQTAFFQALNIATKISKGTVEIVSDKKVLSEGDKVDMSTATLLQKLKISPFFYEMEIEALWEKGVMFSREDIRVTDASIEAALLAGISNVTAISLGAGIPTEASFPHLVLDAFKTLLAVSVETEFVFDEFNGKTLRADIKSGKSAAAAPAAAPAAKAAAPAAKPAAKAKEPEPEEDDDVGLGGLF